MLGYTHTCNWIAEYIPPVIYTNIYLFAILSMCYMLLSRVFFNTRLVLTVHEFRMSAVSRQSEVHYTNFHPKLLYISSILTKQRSKY